MKCDNEPSTESHQDAVIQACAGVEVIPQGPLEGDRMANDHVDMAVRDNAELCGFQLNETQACALQMTARYSAGSLVLHAVQVMNKMRVGKDGKTK